MTRSVVITIAVSLTLTWTASASAASYVVNDVGDGGDISLADTPSICDASAAAGAQCTLRAAIQESNVTNDGVESISFEIPGSGVHTLAPASPYPDIVSPVGISGYTQEGASANTQLFGKPLDTVIKIEIDGSQVASRGFNLGSAANPTTVAGLAIGNFGSSAIGGGSVQVVGNFIGTDAGGTVARPNSSGFFGDGGAGAAVIGGPSPAAANLISGNGENIVTNAVIGIEGNYIGVTRDGSTPLGTTSVGIRLLTFNPPARSAVVHNVIAHSLGNGIEMSNPTLGTAMSENRIFGNDLLGIDLNNDGVTENDPGDADVGANGLQNFPDLESATTGKNGTKITGTLESTPETNFDVQFFSNTEKTRQGRVFLGAKKIGTKPSGSTGFTFKPQKKVKGTKWITATASGADGSTSEFSEPRKVKRGS